MRSIVLVAVVALALVSIADAKSFSFSRLRARMAARDLNADSVKNNNEYRTAEAAFAKIVANLADDAGPQAERAAYRQITDGVIDAAWKVGFGAQAVTPKDAAAAQQLYDQSQNQAAVAVQLENAAKAAVNFRHDARMAVRGHMMSRGCGCFGVIMLWIRDKYVYGSKDGPTFTWLANKAATDLGLAQPGSGGTLAPQISISLIFSAARTNAAVNNLVGFLEVYSGTAAPSAAAPSAPGPAGNTDPITDFTHQDPEILKKVDALFAADPDAKKQLEAVASKQVCKKNDKNRELDFKVAKLYYEQDVVPQKKDVVD